MVVAITRVLSIDRPTARRVQEIDGHLKGMSSSESGQAFRPHQLPTELGYAGLRRNAARDAMEGREILGRYTGADRTFLAEMALAGPWRQVDEFLFFRRGHATNSTKTFPDEWHRRQWFDTSIQASRRSHSRNGEGSPNWPRWCEHSSLSTPEQDRGLSAAGPMGRDPFLPAQDSEIAAGSVGRCDEDASVLAGLTSRTNRGTS